MEKDDHLKKIDILEGELDESKKSQGDLKGELEQMKKPVRMLSCQSWIRFSMSRLQTIRDHLYLCKPLSQSNQRRSRSYREHRLDHGQEHHEKYGFIRVTTVSGLDTSDHDVFST